MTPISLACAQQCKVPLCSCQAVLVTLEIGLRSTSRRKQRQLRRKAVCESSVRKRSTRNWVLKWRKPLSRSRSGPWSSSFSARCSSWQQWSHAQWLPSICWRSSKALASPWGCCFFAVAPPAVSQDSVPLQAVPHSCGARSRRHVLSCNATRRREFMQKILATGDFWRSAAASGAFRWFPCAAWWPWWWHSPRMDTVISRLFFGPQWLLWCAAVVSMVGGRRMGVVEGKLQMLCFGPWFSPSFGQFCSLENLALTNASRISFWNRPRSRLTRPSTPPTNARLSSKATCSQSRTPCARGQVNMRQPGVNWWLAADKTTSVQLWCFCRKGRSTMGFTMRFPCSMTCVTCMAIAGALHSMANRSHGAADGGPNGSPTSSWQHHKNAPL